MSFLLWPGDVAAKVRLGMQIIYLCTFLVSPTTPLSPHLPCFDQPPYHVDVRYA